MPAGNETEAVIVKETTWGTEVAPASSDGIYVMQGSTITRNAPVHHITESSQIWPRAGATATSSIRCTGTIKQAVRYDDFRLPTYFLGNGSNYSTPTETTASEGDYAFTCDPATNIDGLFFTFALLHDSSIHTWQSCKPSAWKFSGESGDDLICKHEVSIITRYPYWESATVNSGHFSGLTFPGGDDNPVRFDQLVFRIADHSDSTDLQSGNELAISSFEMNFKRTLADSLADNVTGRYIREPVNNGLALDTISLTIGFAEFTSDVKDFIADAYAKTHKMADLTFTGAQIGAGTNYSFSLMFPELVLVDTGDSGAYNDAAQLPGTITLNAVLPGDTATAGGTSDLSFNELMRVAVTNNQTAKAVV